MPGTIGNIHQGCPYFRYAGIQCTAVAFVALFLSCVKRPELWNSHTIDHVVVSGNTLFENTIQPLGIVQPLLHEELPSEYNGFTSLILGEYFGVVGQSGNTESQTLAVTAAFDHALHESGLLLTTFGDTTVAVIVNENGIYVFDSHSRNVNGYFAEMGSAVLLHFNTMNSFLHYIMSAYATQTFHISSFQFTSHGTTYVASDLVQSHDDIRMNVQNFTSHGTTYVASDLVQSHDDIRMNVQNDWDNQEQHDNLSIQKGNETWHTHLITNNSNSNNMDITSSALISESFQILERDSYDLYDESYSSLIRKESNASMNIKRAMPHNHTYLAPSSKKKKKNTYKVDTITSSISEICGHISSSQDDDLKRYNNTSDNSFVSAADMDDFDIAAFETISNSSGQNDINVDSVSSYSLNNNSPDSTIKAYETAIRKRPSFHCFCCHKFLFEGQINHLHTVNDCTSKLNLNRGNELCWFCHNRLKKNNIPSIAIYNKICPGKIPDCLKGLSLIEKRLISQVQVFMTILILPGGQYAQKGFAIDFPSDVLSTLRTLPDLSNNANLIIVRGNEDRDGYKSGQGSIHRIVRLKRVHQALRWLQENNYQYSIISVDQFVDNSSTGNEEVNNEIISEIENVGVTEANHSIPDVDLESVLKGVKLPRHKEKPCSVYDIAGGEEMAFPYLFPFGKNGFKQDREVRITPAQYFRQRLMHVDGRFRKDISYLIHAVNQYERMQLFNLINIHMRIRKPKSSSNSVERNLTAGDIENLKSNPDIMDSSYMFMRNIRGTAAYWKNTLLDLLAMLKSLGPPTLFMTLSANDMNWPELIMTLKNCSFTEATKCPSARNLVKNDPLLTAIHFQRRFEALMQYVLNSKQHPLGKISDFFYRVEFQNRGSPHLHLFFWIEGVPSLKHVNSSNEIITYIDSVISTTRPQFQVDPTLHSLVCKLQTHSHTANYCMKHRRNCRFGFPFTPCSKTHFLTNVNISSSRIRGRFYETFRREGDEYVNAYNPIVLRHWRANMDIQFVGNAESAAYYICAYLCKSEPENLRIALLDILKEIKTTFPSPSCKQKLAKIGFTVLKTRQMSAQEAAYRLSNLKLSQRSRTVISLNTKPANKRYGILKTKGERELLDANSTDIFESNIIDYYWCRPNHLENMCLYEFAQWYTKCPESNCKSRHAQERIHLINKHTGICMRKKVKFSVIRSPRLTSNTPEYFYSMLMLFLPHRHECELLRRCNGSMFTCPKEAFAVKNVQICSQNIESQSIIDELETAVRILQCSRKELAASLLPSTSEYEYMFHSDSPQFANISYTLPESMLQQMNRSNQESANLATDEQYLHQLQVPCTNTTPLIERLQSLTNDQRKVMDTIMQYFEISDRHEPLRIFITGGAGVGKSYLIRLLVEWLRLSTAVIASSDPVVITAPTGTAAHKIGGRTLHNALCLPVQHGRQPEINNMSPRSLKLLRILFKGVHTLIIDEISMVSSKTLSYIHCRLCTILDNDMPFGGLNIVAFGDFFQLRPVCGKYAFENTELWQLFTPYFLNENVRQIHDRPYSQLLNRARVGLLNKDDFEVLRSRIVEVLPVPPTTILHIFPTLKQVTAHNAKMQALLQTNIYTVYASHYFSTSDTHSNEHVDESYIPQDDRKAGGLLKTLSFSEGTRVMLLRNLHTAQGLVNGAMGEIHSIDVNPETNEPWVIYIKFDDTGVGALLRRPDRDDSIPIELTTQEFHNKGRFIIREQFPLMPAWACTIHKVQGATLEKCVLSIGNHIFEKGMAYVALSRVQSLEGLFITHLNVDKIQPQEKPIFEYMLSIKEALKVPIDTNIDVRVMAIRKLPSYNNSRYQLKMLVADESGSTTLTSYNAKIAGKLLGSTGLTLCNAINKGTGFVATSKTLVGITNAFTIPDEIMSTLEGETISLTTAVTSPSGKLCCVRGKVAEIITPPHKKMCHGITRDFAEVILQDTTGTATVAMWGECAANLKPAQLLQLSNVRVKLFNEEKKLSTTPGSMKEEIQDAILSAIPTADNDGIAVSRPDDGRIVSIMDVDIFYTCPQCKDYKLQSQDNVDTDRIEMYCKNHLGYVPTPNGTYAIEVALLFDVRGKTSVFKASLDIIEQLLEQTLEHQLDQAVVAEELLPLVDKVIKFSSFRGKIVKVL